MAKCHRKTAPLLNHEHARITRRRVLVVEDHPDAAQILSRLLEIDGHEVAVANEGRSAIVLARHIQPDIVLLDIGLPGMDGYQVVSELVKEPRLRNTLFVALTGYGGEEDQSRAVLFGISHASHQAY